MSQVRLLLVSASMGAGHDGAAHELARRASDLGHAAEVVDLLAMAPRPVAWSWREAYRFQLRLAPESYERSYRLYGTAEARWDRLERVAVAAVRHGLLSAVTTSRPDIVVSTYALATAVLGHLRQRSALAAPVANVLTDMGVHRRTVHDGVDLNIALHQRAAEQARGFTAVPTVVGGAATSPAFGADLPCRTGARAALGVGPATTVVLVVAGSWGVGHVARTVEALCEDGDLHVVTACGGDDRLAADLRRRRLGVAVGWTDRLPHLMAAADVVVENAGGLSSLEAMAAGVPVVSARAIPGHGRDNVRALAAAGLTTDVGDDDAALVAAVRRLAAPGPGRAAQVAAGRAVASGDPLAPILSLVGAGRR